MSSIALNRHDVVVGVDTHKDEHVAVALDGLGGRLDELSIAANPDGYAKLLAWADRLGRVAMFGVEGTGSYGSGLARYLRCHRRSVIEVSRPPRKGERRLSGKSDTLDAEHTAREVLAGKATVTPKLADGIVEAIRLVKIARDSAVNARSQAMITIKATLVTAADDLRGELEHLTDFSLIETLRGTRESRRCCRPCCRHASSSCVPRQAVARPSRRDQGSFQEPQAADQRGCSPIGRRIRHRARYRGRDACDRW